MNVRVLQEIARQRYRQLLFVGALFVMALIMYSVRISLLQDQLLDARRKWSEQRVQVSQKTLPNKAEQYDTGVQQYSQFAARIPSQKEFARVIGDLFGLADNNSLIVGSVLYKPDKQEKTQHDYIVYNITMDVTGKYGGIKSFLADIGQAPEIMTIDTISLGKSGKVSEDEVKLQANLTVLFRVEAQ